MAMILLNRLFEGGVEAWRWMIPKIEELLKLVNYSVSRLEKLLRVFDKSVLKLEEWLSRVGNDVSRLEKLLRSVNYDVLRLEELMRSVGYDAPQLEKLLELTNYDAGKLENLLNSEKLMSLIDNDISKLEDLLKRVGNNEVSSITKFAQAQRVVDKLQEFIRDDKIFVDVKVQVSLKTLADAVQANDVSRVITIIDGNLKGSVREIEAAIMLQKRGYFIEALGKQLPDRIGEIDIISREGGNLVYNEVKAGNAANVGSGSDSWSKFTKQVDRLIKYAKQNNASVRYIVDRISTEAENYIRSEAEAERVELLEIYRFEN